MHDNASVKESSQACMDLVRVDVEKCIKCGICVEVCSLGVIELGAHGPHTAQLNACNSCGHCVAVCPKEALDHVNAPLDKQLELSRDLASSKTDSISELMRTRRSIRNFRKDPVPRATIQELLDVVRFAPTAMNRQIISYHVIDDPERLRAITAAFMDWAEEVARHPSPFSGVLAARSKAYRERGRDGLLWSAPCLINATVPKELLSLVGKTNAAFSLGYAQLYAAALGLGTC